MTGEKKENLTESLKKLEEIASWFEDQEEIDIEVGLEKIKEGAELVKMSKKRLSEIENEFNVIQRDVEKDVGLKTAIKTIIIDENDDEEIRVENIPF